MNDVLTNDANPQVTLTVDKALAESAFATILGKQLSTRNDQLRAAKQEIARLQSDLDKFHNMMKSRDEAHMRANAAEKRVEILEEWIAGIGEVVPAADYTGVSS